jgi:hypothetical protein
MLDTLKSKLKELAELRRDIQMSDEYIAERRAEYEATEAYKSYKKAVEAKEQLNLLDAGLQGETKKLLREHFLSQGIKFLPNSIFIDSDLSQYLDGG